jgi:predicted Zn-dependent peptidase
MRRAPTAVAALMLCLAATTGPGAQQAIPSHPSALTFPPLAYTPPERATYRHVLANGVVGYFVEDHAFPLVNVSVLLHAGSYLDPAEKVGLASAVGSQMRSGGAGNREPLAFDEEVAFLAAGLNSGIGATSGQVSANFLAKDTDAALALLFDVLRRPRFDAQRLALFKTQALQQMARRNDDTGDIEGREWLRLMRGADHFTTRPSTRASIEGIAVADLVEFHRKYVHPGNIILAVSGDFSTPALKAAIEKAMAGWMPGAKTPPVPDAVHQPRPGVYLVDKPDVNQGRVSIGHLGIKRGHPDEIALDVMNDVLGGGGFTSRILSRVRSDEGLAYSAGSSLAPGVYYPGLFRATFQSKSESVARAAAIVMEEVARIRESPITAEELDVVKSQAIEVFPRYFASAGAIAGTFANDELTGRDPKFWQTYRDRVRAVTIADVQRVARTHLRPDAFAVLIVGNVDAILKGDPDHAEFSVSKLSGGRPSSRIPLPDPMTMQYPASAVERP